ncbi:MAG: DNA polymerase I [Phycisphaerales bacterium]|nr:DNA polymerase I [Phycisphaerales bacterium]
MKTLYLIDGYAQFFRAFHAIRTPMSSPVTKEPTNATFGFVGMLLKVLRELKPDYLAVAIDVSGDTETFRSEMYPEYKATREAPPESLFPQIDRCIALLREIGVPVVGVEGFEADDVIATVADQLAHRKDGLLVRIVSKDKDLQQLLEQGHIEMFDVHTDQLIDEAKLKEEKGVTPAQVVDMLALMGDKVDNVPGVDGIGPKTAAQLIGEYGSMENLLANIDTIKGKRQENIRAAMGHLGMSKTLVTLRRDVPMAFDLGSAEVGRLHLDRLMPILQQLGFNRYQQELREILGGDASVEAKPSPEASAAKKRDAEFAGGLFAGAADEDTGLIEAAGEYECVRTKKALDALVKALKKAENFAFDTETTSLEPRRADLCGLSFSTEAGKAWYVPVRSPEMDKHLDEATVLAALKPLLEDAEKPKCGHNLKYDMLVLRRAGVEVSGFDSPASAADSMVASYLIDASRSSHSMDALSLGLLGHRCIPISDLIGSGKNQRTFETVDLERATIYAAEDADISLRLWLKMREQIGAMKLDGLFRGLEMPLVAVLAEMEWNGIRVEPGELSRQEERLRARIEQLRAEILDASPRDFNPDSPKQLSSILFNPTDAQEPGLGLRPIKKTKTGYSTDVEVLEKLAADDSVESPVPQLIVEYRQLTKLVSTYLVALREAINPETGRVHASFHQTVAATGRLSSSDPNLQNIPIRTDIGREIRRAFVAEDGHVLISADYSQIELRLLAHLSDDPALIEAFHAGQDIHRAVAAQIAGIKPEEVTRKQRDGAKMVNFGIVYGVTPYGLARRLGISNAEAGEIIDGYKKRFAGITTFLEECIAQAKRLGYVETIMKRRRPIQGIDSRNQAERSLAERMAINSVVQGSAADLIKVAMVDLHARTTGPKREIDGVKMLLQIHDELVFESEDGAAKEAEKLIVSRMEGAMALKVPLVVEAGTGRSWFEKK